MRKGFCVYFFTRKYPKTHLFIFCILISKYPMTENTYSIMDNNLGKE